jgi:hypothetical protein
MPQVDFSHFYYYPSLLSSAGEHLGYRELPDADKRRLVPIFELSQRGNPANLNDAQTAIRETSAGRPFILDLCKDPAPPPYVPIDPTDDDLVRIERARQAQASYNTLLQRLLSADDGFAVWREMVANFPNAIATIQFTDAASQARQILRQAMFFSRGGNSIAIRVTEESVPAIYAVIAQIISILESPDRLLIVIDSGQARQFIAPRARYARDAMAHILNSVDIAEQPLVRAVCMTNSFPRPGHEGVRSYRNLDWRLWREAREGFPFTFGDYAAIHRIPRSSFIPPGKPTVVLPLDEAWIIYRHTNTNDETGWVTGARLISENENFATAPAIWGTNVIRRAATGDLNGLNYAWAWHASKVNIHIHRQLDFAQNNITSYGGDD